MKHLLITTALCLAATTAWAGGSGHDPAPTSSATTYNAAGAVAGSAAHSQAGAGAAAQGGRATARTGPITVNNNPGGGYGGGYNGPRYSTPDAIAPSIVTANECALPRSFGVSAILAGLGGGWANESENCKRQRMANYLDRAEDHATAREMRCLEDDMRRAAYSSGHPCAKDRLGWDPK